MQDAADMMRLPILLLEKHEMLCVSSAVQSWLEIFGGPVKPIDRCQWLAEKSSGIAVIVGLSHLDRRF